MSVVVIVRVDADASKMREYASQNEDQLTRITERAKEKGALHHAFFGAGNQVVVIDEWETAEGFQEFFASDEEIPQVMQGVGAAGEPTTEFLEPLELGDEF